MRMKAIPAAILTTMLAAPRGCKVDHGGARPAEAQPVLVA